jgi:hypothetical protein
MRYYDACSAMVLFSVLKMIGRDRREFVERSAIGVRLWVASPLRQPLANLSRLDGELTKGQVEAPVALHDCGEWDSSLLLI